MDTRAVQQSLLKVACEHLAEHSQNQQLARHRIRLALVYPTTLLCAALAIVAFLLGVVIPDVVQVFTHHQQALPALIRLSMALNEGGQRLALPLAGVLVAAGLLARLAVCAPRGRLRWHGLLLRIPIFGALVQGSEMARALHTLAPLMRSGAPLAQALDIAAGGVGNLMLRQHLQAAAKAVSEGATLARSLERRVALAPVIVHLLSSVERTGDLANRLERAAQMQEKLLAGRISHALGLFQPLMLAVMSAVLLFIGLAIFMPVLSLSSRLT